MKKIISIPVIFLLLVVPVFSQHTLISLGTDLGVMRSFRKEQRFFSFGHTIHGHFHLAPKDGIYVWLSYYRNGGFENDVTAVAKFASIVPQEIDYKNKASIRLRHFSAGWRKYLKGTYFNEENYNIYAYAGLGMLFGRASNDHSVAIDTALYVVPVLRGDKAFKRLTLDLGLGYELPVGNALFLYAEGRAWIAASDYPSRYLVANRNAPLTGMFNFGLRILFD